MITIDGRKMNIPADEKDIGHSGDNMVEKRIFSLPLAYQGLDLSAMTFKLDTTIDGIKDIIDLGDKVIGADSILLTWTVLDFQLHSELNGDRLMQVKIRAYLGTGEVWNSEIGYLTRKASISAASSYPSVLPSEFIQMEQRVTTLRDETVTQAGVTTAKANEALASATAAELSEAYAYDSEVNAKASETAAKVSEDNAKTSETNSKASETNTVNTFNSINTGEAGRVSAEQSRVTAEATRVLSETNRETAEGSRATAENGRITAEQGRVSAEQSRNTAEATRANFYSGFNASIDNLQSMTDTAIVDTKTGTSVQSIVADDYIAELKIEGATLVTKANPDLDISPDNVATIVSASNFNLVAVGKNLLDVAQTVALGFASAASISIGASAKSVIIAVKPSTVYTFSKEITGTRLRVYGTSIYPSPGVVGNMYYANDTGTTLSFTTTADTYYIVAYYAATSDVAPQQVQMETGSTATTYHTYKSNSHTIIQELRKLPNGVADTIEKDADGKWYHMQIIKKIILNGSESWSISGTSGNAYYMVLPTNAGSGVCLCDKFPYVLESTILSSGVIGIGIKASNSFLRLGVQGLGINTVSDLKQWLASNPITIYYALVTPDKTLISDTKLTTYKGTTNINSTATVQPSITATFKSRLANAYSVLMADITKIKQAIITMGGTV